MTEKYVAVRINEYLEGETVNLINAVLMAVSDDLGLRENQIRLTQDITQDPLKLEQHKFIMITYLNNK
jgi:hypothetical protein